MHNLNLTVKRGMEYYVRLLYTWLLRVICLHEIQSVVFGEVLFTEGVYLIVISSSISGSEERRANTSSYLGPFFR